MKNWVENKTGKIGQRTRKAYREIYDKGFQFGRDSAIKAFVKLERYFEEGKAPRMIMGRDPKFNVLYSQFIEPYEKAFFSLEQVANACDFEECGRKFAKLLGAWMGENDMSKFEATQWFKLLFIEFYVMYLFLVIYLKFDEDVFVRVFAEKCIKDVKTGVGISAYFLYCRGSGDMDTSCGNGTINYVTTQYFLIKNFCPKCQLDNCSEPGCMSFSFVLKGDDSYFKMPCGAKPHNYYAQFGLDAKLIVREEPEKTEFCSGKFVEYQRGKYIYVQKLQKLLDSLQTCINSDFVRRGCVGQYYRSLGMMYKKLYGNLPYYRDIADFLCRSSKHGLQVELVDSWNLKMAFAAEHSTFEVDESLATLSISEVNEWTYSDLERLKIWCRTHTLKLPVHLDKRYTPPRVRKTDPQLPDMHYSDINTACAQKPSKDVMRIMHKLKGSLKSWVSSNTSRQR